MNKLVLWLHLLRLRGRAAVADLVNVQSVDIFNGVFESQKSRGNGKKFREMRRQKIWGVAVNQTRIYHKRILGDWNGPLTYVRSPRWRALALAHGG